MVQTLTIQILKVQIKNLNPQSTTGKPQKFNVKAQLLPAHEKDTFKEMSSLHADLHALQQ